MKLGKHASDATKACGARLERIIPLILFLLFFSNILYSAEAKINVFVTDQSGSIVPDALVIVDYQALTSNSKEVVQKTARGFTETNGKWSATLTFEDSVTPQSYAHLRVITPLWSSEEKKLRITTDGKEATTNFKVPIEYKTYHVRVERSNKRPLKGSTVRIDSPFFQSRVTDATGLATFRFPKGLIVSGHVEYAGMSQEFSFLEEQTKSDEKTETIDVRHPFSNPKKLDDAPTYDYSTTLLDSNNSILANHPVLIETDQTINTYLTDTYGTLELSNIPQKDIRIHWSLYNFIHHLDVDLEDPPNELKTPSMLKIDTPQIIHLGESCYKVEVNITDLRDGTIKSVEAFAEDSNDSLVMTVDLKQNINKSVLLFYRVFCVNKDTNFNIRASGPHESASIRIKLLKDVRSMPKNITEDAAAKQPNEKMLDDVWEKTTKKKEDDGKIQMVVIFVEILVLLVVLFLVVHFRDFTIYVLQSILRFAYYFIRRGK